MDFAFLNAILRGGEIPPNEPWLSGFAISYYYLGYLIIAQVTALAGIPSGIAYNLALATLAALANVSIYSLVYNLVASQTGSNHKKPWLASGVALLGPLFLTGISNLTGLLTMTYNQALLPDELYTWLNVNQLTLNPETGMRDLRNEVWWWWPASRTISDLDAAGNYIVVIDEFPFFSFLLGDLHPHVLALPFTLLNLTVALNALRGALAVPQIQSWRTAHLPPEAWGVDHDFGKLILLLTIIIVGGMGMINTWDLPTLLTIIVSVWFISALAGNQKRLGRFWIGWLNASILLGAGALSLYLPFYISFRSQAAGIRLSPFTTLPQQYLLMFGLFWLVLLPLGLSQIKRVIETSQKISRHTLIIILLMQMIDCMLLFFLIWLNIEPDKLALLAGTFWLAVPLAFFWLIEEDSYTPLVIAQVAGFPLIAGLATQRWTMSLIAALLMLLMMAIWASAGTLLSKLRSQDQETHFPTTSEEGNFLANDFVSPAVSSEIALFFALGLAAVALLLTMGAEIFYIKDQFSGRMNTIFKLYYQAWTLMSIASGFGLFYLVKRLPFIIRLPWLGFFIILTVSYLWYPVAALQTKANFNDSAKWDGRFWLENSDPDRFAAIEWLNTLTRQVVIVEKTGQQYREQESAFAGWTGHSTLIGWSGHELQWRGTFDEVGRREEVVKEIYQTTDSAIARSLIDEWNINDVVITPLEITLYRLSDKQINKFSEFMSPVFKQGEVMIFGR